MDDRSGVLLHRLGNSGIVVLLGLFGNLRDGLCLHADLSGVCHNGSLTITRNSRSFVHNLLLVKLAFNLSLKRLEHLPPLECLSSEFDELAKL